MWSRFVCWGSNRMGLTGAKASMGGHAASPFTDCPLWQWMLEGSKLHDLLENCN